MKTHIVLSIVLLTTYTGFAAVDGPYSAHIDLSTTLDQSLPAFDQSLGTLTKVHYAIDGTINFVASFENSSGFPVTGVAGTLTWTEGVWVGVKGFKVSGSVTKDFSLRYYDGVIDFQGPSSTNLPSSISLMSQGVLEEPEDLILFRPEESCQCLPIAATGPRLTDWTFSPSDAEIIMNGSDHNIDGVLGRSGSVNVSITYEYKQRITLPRLILITHGWNPTRSTDNSWITDMRDNITFQLNSQHGGDVLATGPVFRAPDGTIIQELTWDENNRPDFGIGSDPNGEIVDWDVVDYHWPNGAFAFPIGTDGPNLAGYKGVKLAQQLGQEIHDHGYEFVHLIAHSAGSWLIDAATDKIKALDAKEGKSTVVNLTFLDAYAPGPKVAKFGDSADWAEQYVNRDDAPFTNFRLCNAFNLDVTTLSSRDNDDGHGWPVRWYFQTTGFPTAISPFGWGFANTKEYSGTSPNFADYQKGALFNLQDGSYSGPSALCKVAALFDLSFDPATIQQSDTGIVSFPDPNSVHLQTGSPVWVSQTITATQPINYLQFKFAFDSPIKSAGLLSVFFDGKTIFQALEANSLSGTQDSSYIWLGNTFATGDHTLEFHVETTTSTQSDVLISAGKIGFAAGLDDSLATTLVCDAGGPYATQCQAAATKVQLDGSKSNDPDGGPLIYLWSSDCPSASFDIPTSSTPVLSLDSAPCPVTCNVTLTVTDSKGASSICKTLVTFGVKISPPTIITQPASQDVSIGSDVTFSVAASGTPPLSYKWLRNGIEIAGETSATLTLKKAQLTNVGFYSARVSNAAGSVTSATATLTVSPPNTPPTFSDFADVSMPEDTYTTGINFTVSDQETPVEFLTVSARSSNPGLLPNENIFMTRDGADWRMALLPLSGQSGTATVTISVSDSKDAISKSFVLTVTNPSDFNGDGFADILFQHQNGDLAAWFMSQTDLITGLRLTPGNPEDGWRAVGVGDFDRNGKPDVLFQHSDGSLAVWYENILSLVSVQYLSPSNPGSGWRVAAVGDLNRDGNVDLLFQLDDGTLAVWYLNGVTRVRAELLNPSQPGPGWRAIGLGDFNSDSKLDVIFQHADGRLAVWFMDGSSLPQLTLLTPADPGAGWQAVGVGDYNQDGQVDLLFQHDDGSLGVGFMEGTNLSNVTLLNPPTTGDLGWRIVGPK